MYAWSKTAEEAKPAENERGDTIFCDVIASNAEGVLAGVKTADCVPILLGDPATRRVCRGSCRLARHVSDGSDCGG